MAITLKSILENLKLKFNFRFMANGAKQNKPSAEETVVIQRDTFTNYSTIGQLLIDDKFVCWTLELSCRKENANGKLAIPSGKYQVVITKSPKFGYFTPELLGVPGREGIRIHPANWPTELEGCIAPGFKKKRDTVLESRNAYKVVFEEIEKRLKKSLVYVSVVGGGSAENSVHNL